MIAEEIQRRLAALRQAATDFSQYANLIDGNFETKLNEIKAMELKRENVRKEIEVAQNKANQIIQEASELASSERKDAAKLLDEAKNAKLQAAIDQQEAQSKIAEAQALYQQAIEKQRTADSQWMLIQQKQKKLEEAMR